jgi:hypothetical protein
VSDPVREPVSHPLSAAVRQTFQERVADHVSAIVAAARELQAAAAPGRDLAPYREGADEPVLANTRFGLAPPGSTVIHIPLDPAGCPAETLPIFVQYVAGHFATGEPYYAQDVWCV